MRASTLGQGDDLLKGGRQKRTNGKKNSSRILNGSKRLFLWVVATQFLYSFAQSTDDCNVPQSASGTSGLLQRMVEIKSTLGYAGLDSVQRLKAEEDELDTCVLNIAQMRNKWGRVVSPTADGAQAAVRSKSAAFLDTSCPGFGLCAEVHDGPDADVWPLSTLTYLIVPTNTTDAEEGCDRMKTLYDYVKWILTDDAASDIAKDLSMATMPKVVAEQALALLDQMQCREADGVTRLVKDRATRADALEGGGSSLQGNLQTKLTNAFFQQSFISIAYTASSSGTGRATLRDHQVHFAGSDSILDMSDQEFIRRGMKMIPAFAAAVAIVYNLDGANQLVLTRDAVAGMFTGTITSWANPAIRDQNQDAFLPDDAIVRVVRASKSGTTGALTKAIYSFAGLPQDELLDYALHPLKGSGLPDWPVPELPYADGAVCRFRGCIKQICGPGLRLDLAAEACVPCAEGHFSDLRGQHTECQACPPGSYASSEGNSKCAKCDETQYQDGVGARECKNCPANTRRFFMETTVEGATVHEETPGVSAGECKCLEGYWLPSAVNRRDHGGETCLPCPDGAVCPGFKANSQQIPEPKKGFWGDPSNPRNFIECHTGFCDGAYTCGEGHVGRLCVQPAEGHFVVGRRWFPRCPAGSTIMALAAGVGLLVLWVRVRDLCFGSMDACAVVVGAWQVSSLISLMRLRWHPPIEAAMAVLGLVNFDVSFFGWQCVWGGWDGVGVFVVQLCLPFILTSLSLCNYMLRWSNQRRARAASHDKKVRSKGVLRSQSYLPDSIATYLQGRLLSYLLLMYHTLIMYAVAPFVCSVEPDGKTHYVSLLPDVQCDSSGHRAMRILAIVYMLLVLVPVPVFLANKIHRGLQRDELGVYDFMEQFGFMYLKFSADQPWWELVLLARKTLLSLVVVTVSVPMIQAVLAVLIVNLAMYLHLVCRPMVHRPAALLELAGLFCALVMAACGMLFFPSLDNAVECVGSADLVASIGEQCGSNQTLKARVAALLLFLFALLGLAAVAVSAMDAHARHLANKATLRMETLQQQQRQRGVGDNTDGSSVREAGRTPQRAAPPWWHGIGVRLGLRSAVATTTTTTTTDGGEGNAHTLKLCHMISGYHLYRWQRRVERLERAEASGWRRVRATVGLHREELAYLGTDKALSKFATIFDHVSGYYVSGGLARKLRELERALPLLIDMLASADAAHRKDFALVAQSLTLYSAANRSRAMRDVVVTEYRTPVLHWLMRCSAEQRRGFRLVFAAIASASGLATGTNRNLGLGIPVRDDFRASEPDRSPHTAAASAHTPNDSPIAHAAACQESNLAPASADGRDGLPGAPPDAIDGGWGPLEVEDVAEAAPPRDSDVRADVPSPGEQRFGLVATVDTDEIAEDEIA